MRTMQPHYAPQAYCADRQRETVLLLMQLVEICGAVPVVDAPPELGHGFMADVLWAAKKQDEELDELYQDDDIDDDQPMIGGYA